MSPRRLVFATLLAATTACTDGGGLRLGDAAAPDGGGAAPAVQDAAPEGPLPQAGHKGPCAGCWRGDVCLPGDALEACGASGTDCVECPRTFDICTQAHCRAGTCTNERNDLPLCRPPVDAGVDTTDDTAAACLPALDPSAPVFVLPALCPCPAGQVCVIEQPRLVAAGDGAQTLGHCEPIPPACHGVATCACMSACVCAPTLRLPLAVCTNDHRGLVCTRGAE